MTDQSLQRKRRLAAALRENLKRRKIQQRARVGVLPQQAPHLEESLAVDIAQPAPPQPQDQSHGPD